MTLPSVYKAQNINEINVEELHKIIFNRNRQAHFLNIANRGLIGDEMRVQCKYHSYYSSEKSWWTYIHLLMSKSYEIILLFIMVKSFSYSKNQTKIF